MSPHRAGLLVALITTLNGCGDGASPPQEASGAGSTTGGVEHGGTSGAAGFGGNAGDTALPGGTGSGGVGGAGSGGGGAGGTANAIAGAAGAASSAGAAGSGSNDGFPTADCAPGAVFCDGFEAYPLHNPIFDENNDLYDLIPNGATEPAWLAYHFHGPARVDTSKPFKGAQEMHLDTEAGDLRYADIIKESADGVELVPPAHYGRVMLWLKAMPQASRWNIIHESGLLAGSTSEVAQFSFGGAQGKLAMTYSQYGRIVKNAVGVKNRRGGGPQNGDPPPQVQCSVTATTQALATGKWVCVEWMLDRTKGEMHLWLDGAAQTEVDVTGGAGSTCSVGSATTWQGPDKLTELVLGWEAYEKDAPGQEAWFDEVAIGRQRLGCPMP